MREGEFFVTPDVGGALIVLLLLLVVGGVITAAKGRWGWLALGIVFGGLLLPLTACLMAAPDSLWARAFYGPKQMERARRRFPLRVNIAIGRGHDDG